MKKEKKNSGFNIICREGKKKTKQAGHAEFDKRKWKTVAETIKLLKLKISISPIHCCIDIFIYIVCVCMYIHATGPWKW